MAGKKIGLVLALDGESEYTQALRNAKKETNLFKTEIKNLSQEFSGNANSMEALSAKQGALTKQQEAYQRKLQAAKSGLDNAKKNYNQQADALDELKKKLEEAKNAQQKMEKTGDTSSDAYKEQTKQIQELSEAVDKQTVNTLKASGRVTDWNKQVAESEGELKKTNRALEQNEKYLLEAERSSDKCATSIDGLGREIKDTGDGLDNLGGAVRDAASDLDNVGEKASTFKSVLAANLTGTAIVGGLKKIGDTAKEAAEYSIEVGSSFEAAMSEVAAISGACGNELDAMTQKAKELGASTKFSATEAAEAFKYMSLAGWDTTTMLSGIDGVLNLAAASGMELAAASDMVTDYLSAFGMAASESAYMADLLAYAQANSNTTAEQMGEAYRNSAANMHSAGQDIETTTSLLEAMANQGLKGSEAGTALSAMMRDITAKMKDGKIAIGDTTVAVMDAKGNYRDLTDILTDVEDATDGMGDAEKNTALQSTFTADSIKGLNLILADGMGNISKYEEELRKSEGTAKDMADTMQNNLSGDLTTMNSALEGLGIAAYAYVNGPLRGTVQGVTSVINGITNAITPQKSEIEQFIEGVKSSNDEIQTMLENASQTLDDAEIDVSKYEVYKQTITDINELESASSLQKYELQQAVDALSGDIPELAAAWDSETERINLSKEAIIALIDQQAAYKKETAASLAMQETYNAKIAAEANALKAESAVKDIQKRYEAMKKLNEESEDFARGGFGDYYKETLELENALDNLTDEQEKANAAAEEANSQYESLQKYVEETTAAEEEASSQVARHADELDGLAQSEENLADAAGESAEAVEEAEAAKSEAAQAGAEAQKNALQAVTDKYNEFRSQLESDIQNKISLFDTFDGGTDITVEEMLKNLESQREGLEKWKSNMETLSQEVGTTISEGFYNSILEMGPEAANAVEHMVKTLEQSNGRELLQKMSEEWCAGMDFSKTASKAFANTQIAIAAGLREIGSTDADFSALKTSIETAAADAESAWAGLDESTRKAIESAIQTAQEMGIQIPEGLAEGIASGETSPESAIEQINGSISGMFDGLAEIARQQGVAIPPELAAGIKAGGQEAVNAYNALIEMLSGKSAEAEAAGQEVGQANASGMAEGAESGQGQVETAGANIAKAGAEKAGSQASAYQKSGLTNALEYGRGLQAGTGTASASGAALAIAGSNAASSYSSSFYNAGVNAAAGMARGISAGASGAVEAAANMARQALNAAKATLEIKSPSRKFKNEVGQQIGKGLAFGIKDSASLAGKEASKMSSKVYKNATSWLAEYKKSHKISLTDEQYYWQQVAKHTKVGTTAYENAQKKLAQVNKSLIGNTLSGKIDKNFNVSRTTTTGSGNNKKTEKKSDAAYYSEIYSAADRYLSNYQTLHNMSLEQEEAYWTAVQKKLKKGTQGWYDAQKQINNIREDIKERDVQAEEDAARKAEEAAQKAQDRITETVNVQNSALEKFKVYSKVSAKAEMDYWNLARAKFKEGTEERIEADQKYLEAREDYYNRLEELEEEHAEKEKEINEELEESIKDLQETYEDAVSSRKKEILSSMNLFEAWDASGYEKDILLKNLKTQTEGLKFWEKQLEELGKKNISAELLEELKALGPDAAANIWSLNQMTAAELDEYNRLWKEKNDLAEQQAARENEKLLKETNDSIERVKKEAQEKLKELNADYNRQVAELNEGLNEGLKNLVKQSNKIGEDMVSGLIAGIKKQMDEKQQELSGIWSSVTPSTAAGTGNSSPASAGGTASTTKDAIDKAASAFASTKNILSSSDKKDSETDKKIKELLNSGEKHKKSLSEAEKKAHGDLWQYIVLHYGHIPTTDITKQLASLLGIKVNSSPTTAQKNKILAELKLRGYARGIRKMKQDELAWTQEKGPELLVGAGGGMVTYLPSGSSVIPANLTDNLFGWGAINPEAFFASVQKNMERQQAALQQQIQLLDSSGITKLNHLLESQQQETVVYTDNSDITNAIGQMVTGMEALLERLEHLQLIMYPDVVAGELQPWIDKKNADAALIRNRGRY